MRAVDRASGDESVPPRDRECYRCDRDVTPQWLFRVDVSPTTALSGTYGHAGRYCCVDCAAGMNLSEFSERIEAHARGKPDIHAQGGETPQSGETSSEE